MNNKRMELEIAYRKMYELQQQAAHDQIVNELKEARKKQDGSFWQNLTGILRFWRVSGKSYK